MNIPKVIYEILPLIYFLMGALAFNPAAAKVAQIFGILLIILTIFICMMRWSYRAKQKRDAIKKAERELIKATRESAHVSWYG